MTDPAVRPAHRPDAPALARLETLAGGPPGALARWTERLRLPAGDDHFVLVATGPDGAVLAYAAAGGSRDGDGKGDGELYALATDPGTDAGVAGRACDVLLTTVLRRLAAAGYARATCSTTDGPIDRLGASRLHRAGFATDPRGAGRRLACRLLPNAAV